MLNTYSIVVGGIGGLGEMVLRNTDNSLYTIVNSATVTVAKLSDTLIVTTFTSAINTIGNNRRIAYNPTEDLFYIAYENGGNTEVVTMTPLGIFGATINTIPLLIPIIHDGYSPLFYNAAKNVVQLAVNGTLYNYAGGALIAINTFLPTGAVTQIGLTPSGNILLGISNTIVNFNVAPLSIAGFNIDGIQDRINAGAYLVDELKITSTDIGQFAYPIIITNTTLTQGADSSHVLPVDNLGVFTKQNVVVLDSKSLNYFIASLEGKLQMMIKANNVVNLTIKGKYYQLSDTLKKEKKRYGKL